MSDVNTDVTSPDTALKSLLTFRLAQLQNKLNTHASHLLKTHSDLSLAEWRIISMIHNLKHTTMTKLRQETVMDKGQLSRNLKRLVEKNYVQATASESDARQQNLCLSQNGKKVYQDLLPQMRQRQHDLVQNVAAEDMVIFDRVLAQLNTNINTMKATDLPTGKQA